MKAKTRVKATKGAAVPATDRTGGFDMALCLLKLGVLVTRQSWRDGIRVYLAPRKPTPLFIYDDPGGNKYKAGWTPSTDDLLARDWVVQDPYEDVAPKKKRKTPTVSSRTLRKPL
jgi:hypothetical protein